MINGWIQEAQEHWLAARDQWMAAGADVTAGTVSVTWSAKVKF